MMAGRPGGDEGVGGFFAHHFVDGKNTAADRAQRRFITAGRHRGVAVDLHHALFRRRVADADDVIHRMTERDAFERRHRRQFARQRLEFFRFERTIDRAQPVGTLGVPRRHQMVEASEGA